MVATKETTTVTQVTSQPPPITPITVVTPVPTEAIQPVVSEDYSDVSKRVAAMELSQQSVRDEVSSMNQQVITVNNNVNNLNSQIANLNQVITNLSTQLTKQSEEIDRLMVKNQPKRVVRRIIKIHNPSLYYYIQAVIPGRAWLIATNGSTLTVREGTKIPGYGMVKLIDPLQGRVITSSGQVIRFSQEDS